MAENTDTLVTLLNLLSGWSSAYGKDWESHQVLDGDSFVTNITRWHTR